MGCVLASYKHSKELWDVLKAKYGSTTTDTELYMMEQYCDYKMTSGKFVVKQAHEIQCMTKKLERLKINLPDKFVASGIIAKLPPSWKDLNITLKHKRTYISVLDLIASLDVEDKGRVKDGRSTTIESQANASMR